MKFYKCHATKLKNEKVIQMGDQFTEVGPDAFLQTQFEVILLSKNVTIIRNHAFAKVEHCAIYIPPSAEEIEPMAFDDMGYGNVIYCEKNTAAHKICMELDLEFSTDVVECMNKAKRVKEEDEHNKKLAAIREAEAREAERIRKEAQEEAERIRREALEEVEKMKKAVQEAERMKKEAEKAAEKIKKEAEAVKRTSSSQTSTQGRSVTATSTQARPAQTSRPVNRTTSNESNMFRNIDKYDDELQKLEPQGPTLLDKLKGVVREIEGAFEVEESENTFAQNYKAPSNINYSGTGMQRLDNFDDELQKMEQKEEKTSVWSKFLDVKNLMS